MWASLRHLLIYLTVEWVCYSNAVHHFLCKYSYACHTHLLLQTYSPTLKRVLSSLHFFLLLPNPCYEACNPSNIALHLYSLTCACVFEDPKLNGEAAKAALANEDCPHIDQAISPEDGQIFSPCEPRRETTCFLLNMTGRATHPGARGRKGT